MRRVLLLLVLLLPVGARADNLAQVTARQAAGLFMQSCVAYAGNPTALRAWAGKIGLPALPEPGQAGFLKGSAGRVYDASNPAGKYVVVSFDDGGCLILAEAVDPDELVRASETALADAGIAAVLDKEEIEQGEEAIHHRTYSANSGERRWTLVISHGQGTPDQAMLSASPR
jgi:hypothetical protein